MEQIPLSVVRHVVSGTNEATIGTSSISEHQGDEATIGTSQKVSHQHKIRHVANTSMTQKVPLPPPHPKGVSLESSLLRFK